MFLESIKMKFAALLEKAKTDISELWAKDKGYLILFGVVILGVKFREILIDLLVGNAKATFDKTQKESDVLQKVETDANSKADQLVQDSQALSQDNTTIDDDWNKK